MAKENNYNISGEHLVEEMAEHIALEKAGVLHEHITAIKPKPKKERSNFWFYTIGYSVIGIELWLIYEEILKL